jgi:heme-degrading monooxygenase HmoA
VTTGYLAVWEFLVLPGRVDAFERLYGPDGEWVRLFQRAPGFIRTELLRDRGNPQRFLTLDHWESRRHWERFRLQFDVDVAALDARGAALTERETRLGEFEP